MDIMIEGMDMTMGITKNTMAAGATVAVMVAVMADTTRESQK
jgi:hypothetical protein